MPVVTLEALERYIWWVTIAGHLLLFVKMWRTGLGRTYRFFCYYLLFRVVRACLLTFLPQFIHAGGRKGAFSTPVYAWTWLVTEPILWFFYILVLLELYSLVLRSYKGIATLSRWAMWVALGLALVLSLVTLAPDLASSGGQSKVLRYFGLIDRGIVSSLVLFLLLITGFLAWYPIQLSRNVVVHCSAYAIYFLSTALTLLVRNLFGDVVTQAVNVVLSAIMLACLVVWLVFLTPAGEAKTVVVRRQWTASDEEGLVRQLAAINSSLLRTARK